MGLFWRLGRRSASMTHIGLICRSLLTYWFMKVFFVGIFQRYDFLLVLFVGLFWYIDSCRSLLWVSLDIFVTSSTLLIKGIVNPFDDLISSKRSARMTNTRLMCFGRSTHQYSRTLHNCKQKRRGDHGSNAPAKNYSHILPPNILTPILSHTTHQCSLIVHTNIRTLYTPIFSHPTQLRAEKMRRSRRRC